MNKILPLIILLMLIPVAFADNHSNETVINETEPIQPQANTQDSDLDGIPDLDDAHPFDFDNDGMPDIWERKAGLRPDLDDSQADSDGDGIINIEEYRQGSDPLIAVVKESSQEFLSPAEQIIAKILIYIGVILLVGALTLFILYRAHIFNVAKLIHHVSKNPHHLHHVMNAPQRHPLPRHPHQPPHQPPRNHHPGQQRQIQPRAPVQTNAPKPDVFNRLQSIHKPSSFDKIAQLKK